MRILHVANFSLFKNETTFYSIDKKISNGLIRNGHFVSDFSYRDLAKYYAPLKIKKFGVSKMKKSILRTIDNLEPELILLGHTELLNEEVLEEIKNRYPQMKIAMWWVDWLKNLSSIKNKIRYLDVLFTTTGIKEIDKNLLNVNKNLVISYLPNICDSSIESYKAFDTKEFKQDLFFAGRLDGEREKFVNQLKSKLTKNIRFNTYGTTQDTLLTGNNFLSTINNSKMALNLSRDHNTSLYTSDRIIQLMGNGVLVLSKNIPDIEILFKNNELILFNNILDCKEKIEFYFYNDSSRKEIAYNGWLKAHNSYNATRVTKFMFETIFNLQYTEDYEWKNQLFYNIYL
jgi:hypothetical protein